MIILLIIRLFTVFPMYFDLITNGEMIVSSYQTLVWLITEILPVLVMVFSLINFGSSSNDDIEGLDGQSTTHIHSVYNNSIDSYIDIKQVSGINIYENSESISENSKEKEILSYSFADCKGAERDKTIMNLNGSISNSENNSNNGIYANNQESIERATLLPVQKTSTTHIEEDIIHHRDSNLKGAFKQMLAEMGVERPSQISLSAVEDND